MLSAIESTTLSLIRLSKLGLKSKYRFGSIFQSLTLKVFYQLHVFANILLIYIAGLIEYLDRKQYRCNYCEKLYSSKNVTKFRLHLLTKCQMISEDIRHSIAREVGTSRPSIKDTSARGSLVSVTEEMHAENHMEDEEEEEEGEPMEEIQDTSQGEDMVNDNFIKPDIDDEEEEEKVQEHEAS